MIKHGSYREYQGYLCKDCNQTLNHNTGTIFEHSTIPLRMWYLAIYIYISGRTQAFNSSTLNPPFHTRLSTGAFDASRGRWTHHNWVQKAGLQSVNGKNPNHIAAGKTVI